MSTFCPCHTGRQPINLGSLEKVITALLLLIEHLPPGIFSVGDVGSRYLRRSGCCCLFQKRIEQMECGIVFCMIIGSVPDGYLHVDHVVSVGPKCRKCLHYFATLMQLAFLSSAVPDCNSLQEYSILFTTYVHETETGMNGYANTRLSSS